MYFSALRCVYRVYLYLRCYMTKEIIIVIIESVCLVCMITANIWMLMKRKTAKKSVELELKKERESALESALMNQRRK